MCSVNYRPEFDMRPQTPIKRLTAAIADVARVGAAHRAAPDTGRNVLMVSERALSAPRQCKCLESHDSITTPRVHHAARRRGSSLAARGARAAAGEAADHRIFGPEHAFGRKRVGRRFYAATA